MITRASTNTTLKRSIRRTAARDKGWNRPDDWPLLPIPATGEQVIHALIAVDDTTFEHTALLCRGAYTVDWGDGVVENFADNARADHTYTYATLNSPVLGDGHKCALVTVRPQSGQNLTTISFQQRPAAWPVALLPFAKWMEIGISAPNCNTLSIGGNALTSFTHCRYVHVYAHNTISGSSLFGRLSVLESFYMDTSGITNFLNMVGSCESIKRMPACLTFESAAQATSANNGVVQIFNNCKSATELPPVPIQAGSTFEVSMYAFCSSLQVLPAMDWSGYAAGSTNIPGTGMKLRRSLVYGMTQTHSYLNSLLDAAALNEIFTNLGTAASGATITISGNPGAATCNQSLATDKGWTVTN
jgi:hypothetical protein